MVMPRGTAGLKPTRPGLAAASRSTQRIVLPSGTPGGKSGNTKSLSGVATAGRINLPIGMILKCLPQEVLASDLAEFEASGAAQTEVGLPMNIVLSQLPSGKIEVPLSELIAHFPPGFLQPTESITNYLPTPINLPLMDVVMRIPPDLLALRPDQKDVDAAVINMADPFTEEILREQAEAARRAAQSNIIEESQAPQEEFVPSQSKTISPPPRPSVPLPGSRPMTAPVPLGAAPISQTSKLPTPPMPATRSAAPPTNTPSMSARTISPSGRLSVPTRATTPIPARPQAAAVTSQISMPPLSPPSAPSAPTPRPTTSSPTPPVPPMPRQTGALPPVSSISRQSGTLPNVASIPRLTPPSPTPPTPFVPPVAATLPPPPAPVAPEPEPEPAPAATASPSDELQRLAALAMEQLGDDNDNSAESAPVSSELESTLPLPPRDTFVPPPAPEPEPEPEPVVQQAPPAPEPVAVAPAPVPAPVAPPAPVPEPAKAESQAAAPSASVAFNLNTCTAEDLVQNIPGTSMDVAFSIVEHRSKIGSYKRIEDLLDVPGITKAVYTNLTGETPPENRIPLSLNELLGFPADMHISLKDVTDRIACWPDVTGCLLSQSTGLSLVGTAPDGLDKAAIVAFAPRMFDSLNKSFGEITGKETDAIILPTPGNSFHIFRNKDLYLIILCRLPQMPERHMKVARFVLSALSIRRD